MERVRSKRDHASPSTTPWQGAGRHSGATLNTTTLHQAHHTLVFPGDQTGVLPRPRTHCSLISFSPSSSSPRNTETRAQQSAHRSFKKTTRRLLPLLAVGKSLSKDQVSSRILGLDTSLHLWGDDELALLREFVAV